MEKIGARTPGGPAEGNKVQGEGRQCEGMRLRTTHRCAGGVYPAPEDLPARAQLG